MHELQRFPVKKTFLYALIGSVVLGAFLGIMAILSGRFGWLEVRILLTTVTIAGASICGLACGALLSTKRGLVLPVAGIGLTLLSAAMIIAGMWLTIVSESYWKVAATTAVYAVACAHLALLSMARLADWFRWSLAAAYAVILGVASLIALLIFGESHGAGMFQLMGVAAIVDAAITVVIPIFHRLSRVELEADAGDDGAAQSDKLAGIDAEIARLRERIAELERMRTEALASV